MSILLALLVLLDPLSTAGRFVGGKLVTPGMVVAIGIAGLTAIRLAEGRYRTIARKDRWLLAFCLFLVVGVLSILFSPYATKIWIKGTTQIVGISIMLLTSLALINEVRLRPVLFEDYVRFAARVLGFVALIGLMQFAVANTTGHLGVFNFNFLNRLAGGSVWWEAKSMGIIRANSIVQEPSLFTVILGLGSGVSLARLGLLGAEYRNRIRPVVPLWSAVCILGGFVVAISLVGYLLLVSAVLALWLVSHRLRAKALAGGIASALVLALFAYAAASTALPALRMKVDSMRAIVSSAAAHRDRGAISALALAMNVRVMETNFESDPLLGAGLGAQPVTFANQNPGLFIVSWRNARVNAQDACSLIVRLLSESGILGAALFVAGWMILVLRGRKAVLESIRARGVTTYTALAVGTLASLVGVGVACLGRAPEYYALWLWLPMALAACVTDVLERESNLLSYRSGADSPASLEA